MNTELNVAIMRLEKLWVMGQFRGEHPEISHLHTKIMDELSKLNNTECVQALYGLSDTALEGITPCVEALIACKPFTATVLADIAKKQTITDLIDELKILCSQGLDENNSTA